MKHQFEFLKNWTFEILSEIKKDIKNDHLPSNPPFYRTYFGNRPQNRLTAEEIFAAYEKELMLGNQDLADWVVNRWVFKHGDLYEHFAQRLGEIHPDFDEIEELTEEQSKRVLEGAINAFGAIPVFLFSLLNGVVFPQTTLNHLLEGAEKERDARDQKMNADLEQQSLEKIIAAHQREIQRLNQKILGVQKKYEKDTEQLKKQMKGLQQKLNWR